MTFDFNHKQPNNTTRCDWMCHTLYQQQLLPPGYIIPRNKLRSTYVFLQDFFLAFFPTEKHAFMRLSSRKVGTHQDLKTSSGLKQKHPFRRVWNSSQSPTCFQPLYVFVYSRHGEETFFLPPAAHCKTWTHDTTTEQTDSVPF